MVANQVHPYEKDLDPRPANYVPLTPISFLARAAHAFAEKKAIIHGNWHCTYAEFFKRCKRLASALAKRGIKRLDTVAILAPNVPALLEAHFAVPMLGAVLNPLNTRLDATSIAFSLNHGEAKILIADRIFHNVVADVLKRLDRDIQVVCIDDQEAEGGEVFSDLTYEKLLAEGNSEFDYPGPSDEWQSLCLLYTSGTTGDPKGVVYNHRGAYLSSLGNALTFQLDGNSTYLWTLPMFHCSGWTFTWAVTAVGGTHICLRQVEPRKIFELIAKHRVTHMCGAPIILNMLVHAPEKERTAFSHKIKCATGGAAPPSVVLQRMEAMGFDVTHLYGATESYGPSTVCTVPPEWQKLGVEERYGLMARQGVNICVVDGLCVANPDTHEPVPQDGETIGEILVRGNTVMKGYLKNPDTTEKTFAGGWCRSGDLAVWHSDGYVEIKDRAKDIIISGGENISSLEVEEVLFKHPSIMEVAVVAKPDEKWGETPCAFVCLTENAGPISEDDIIAFCRENMAHFKIPKKIVFGDLPKTATGKIQKFVLRERAKKL